MTGPADPPRPSHSPEADPDTRAIRCQPFAQATGGEPWRMELLHHRGDHVLLWVTRGQGRIVVTGMGKAPRCSTSKRTSTPRGGT